MSKNEFFLNIEKLAEEKIAKVQQNSQLQCQQILDDAKNAAQKRKEEAFVRGKTMAERDRYVVDHRASIEALKLIENAERDLLNILTIELQEKLSSLRSRPSEYEKILLQLIKEAIDQLRLLLPDESNFRLLADPQDKKILEKILKKFPVNVEPDFEVSTWGGVIVSDQSRSVLIDNRLEQRLKNAMPLLTREMLDKFELIHE